jgi:hypothetical protein
LPADDNKKFKSLAASCHRATPDEVTTKSGDGLAEKSAARQFSIRFDIPMAFVSAGVEARCRQLGAAVQSARPDY